MHFYKKIILLFLSILLIGCIAGSLLKVPIDTLIERNDHIAHLVDYKQGIYNYGKIMRRIFMLVAVIAIILFRKRLDLIQLSINGLRFKHGWSRQLQSGLIIGVGSIIIYSIFTYLLGVEYLESTPRSMGEFVLKPFIYLLEACFIGLFEETLFRGFILQGLLKDFSPLIATVSGSFFYAILHLFSIKVNVYPGLQPFIGFDTLITFFHTALLDINSTLPYIIGLFIVGLVLSLAYLQTNALYLPIGLHAGWILGLKLNRLFLDHNHEMSTWFFGDGNIITGLLGWLFLLLVLVIIKQVRVIRT